MFERRDTTAPLIRPKHHYIQVREYDHGGTGDLLSQNLRKIAEFGERDRHVPDGVTATSEITLVDRADDGRLSLNSRSNG